MNALRRIGERLKSMMRSSRHSARRMPGRTWPLDQTALHMQTSSDDSSLSKTNSTTDADPGEAAIAVDSPHAFRGFADQRGSHGAGAYIHVGAGGWLIALTVVSSVSLTALLLMLVYGPSYIDAKVQAGTAQANATANLARTQAIVALDKIEDMRVKLAQKGINVPPLDGH